MVALRTLNSSVKILASFVLALTIASDSRAAASEEGILIPETQRISTAPSLQQKSIKDQWPKGAHSGSIWAAYLSRTAECATQELGYAIAGAYGQNKSGRLLSCYLSFYLTGFTHSLSLAMLEADADVAMATGGTLPATQGTIKNVLLIRKIQKIKRGQR
jgi:hypothetical protein